MSLDADLNDFVHDHRPHGSLTAENSSYWHRALTPSRKLRPKTK
jgi:hypothetical protein